MFVVTLGGFGWEQGGSSQEQADGTDTEQVEEHFHTALRIGWLRPSGPDLWLGER